MATAKAGSPTIRTCHLICLVLTLMLLAVQRPLADGAPEVWLLVDTREMKLLVMQGATARRSYENISIGWGGVTREKRRYDNKTPLGEFHIVRVATDTPFRRFYALDYPSLKDAERGLQDQLINARESAAIRKALQARRIPPQDTSLGGYIGIHGVGKGDPAIHESFNWTNGCIALTNRQIDDLHQWIRVGMRVIVR